MSRRRLSPQPRFAARHDRETNRSDIDAFAHQFAAKFDSLDLVTHQDGRDRVIVTEDAQAERLQSFAQAQGEVKYHDLSQIKDEIARFRRCAPKGTFLEEFATAPSPGIVATTLQNVFYDSHEKYLDALARELRHEYMAIHQAGLILQIDDPGLADAWPTFIPQPPLEDYQRYARIRVDALNHALRGIPPERLRYHLCWGSWHGPHTEDIPLRDIVGLLLQVKARGYSVEAGNVRHEHEWKVWRDVRLPEGKVLIPGVVSHKTSAVEHPELVADRLLNYANLVGGENVQAGTDCGMGLGRVHHEVGWAKLQVLAEGARLASRRLWGA